MIKRILKIPINLLWKIKNKFVRFLFVGVLNTIVGYLLFVICIWIGMYRPIALLVSYILGVMFNYKTTGYLVFENRSNRLLLQFFVVYGIMYVINNLELHYLAKSQVYDFIMSFDYYHLIQRFSLDTKKVGDALGQAIVVLPNAILTFILNKTFVFKDKEKGKDKEEEII
jgi:putative flippase GtrA